MKRWLWVGFCVVLVGLGVWAAVSGPGYWHSYWGQRAYAEGQWLTSRVHLRAWLDTKPSLFAQGKAQVLLAEMALQEDQQAEAEAAIVQGVLRLRQWRHARPHSDTAWLKRALETLVLISLRPWIGVDEDQLWFLEDALEDVDPLIADARGLGSKSRLANLPTLMAQKKPLVLWQEFVRTEPLYQRLRVKPVAVPAPQTPKDQQAVREVVQRWQQLKRAAFVEADTESLALVLTGDALSETQQAVLWWQEQGDNYWDLDLKALRFLRIEYPEPTRAQVVAEIREVRDNSREGVVEQTYRVEYTLVKLGDDWFISRMKVRT